MTLDSLKHPIEPTVYDGETSEEARVRSGYYEKMKWCSCRRCREKRKSNKEVSMNTEWVDAKERFPEPGTRILMHVDYAPYKGNTGSHERIVDADAVEFYLNYSLGISGYSRVLWIAVPDIPPMEVDNSGCNR